MGPHIPVTPGLVLWAEVPSPHFFWNRQTQQDFQQRMISSSKVASAKPLCPLSPKDTKIQRTKSNTTSSSLGSTWCCPSLLTLPSLLPCQDNGIRLSCSQHDFSASVSGSYEGNTSTDSLKPSKGLFLQLIVSPLFPQGLLACFIFILHSFPVCFSLIVCLIYLCVVRQDNI